MICKSTANAFAHNFLLKIPNVHQWGGFLCAIIRVIIILYHEYLYIHGIHLMTEKMK